MKLIIATIIGFTLAYVQNDTVLVVVTLIITGIVYSIKTSLDMSTYVADHKRRARTAIIATLLVLVPAYSVIPMSMASGFSALLLTATLSELLIAMLNATDKGSWWSNLEKANVSKN